MKIAIFHNYMDNIGGAEIVTLTLARELNSDIYTTNLNKEKIRKMGFNPNNIYSIGKIPINAPFRQQAALIRFRKLNLGNKYDFYIISGDWAISAAVNHKPNLEYFHSPVNELWEFKDYIRNELLETWKKPIFDLWVAYNRHLYRKYFKQVEKSVCNSKNTQNRIRKYLNSDAIVINPPIDTSKFKFKKSGDYWLSVNRLFTNKRVDMQINAFKKLSNENLIIVGSYEQSKHFKKYAAYLKKIRPKNVNILHWVNQKKLIDLYSNCKGFITTSQDEDFGITPIEAMASGKPVIAPNEGGYKETIINNLTGKLINNINVNKLVRAIREVGKEIDENPGKYKEASQRQAKKFDVKVFIKKIKEQIPKDL